MISRIRIDAFGATPNEVADSLYPHADEIEKLLGVSVARGECVITRKMEEPEGGSFAYEGRLNLHPDIQGAPEFQGNATTSNYGVSTTVNR